MKKIILKKILNGILYGSAMFTLSLLLIDIVFDSSLTVLPHQYSRIIVGAIIIGVGCVLSSIIYEGDRITFFIRTQIQLVICALVILSAFLISGGIPDGTGFGTGTVFAVVEIGVGFVFWIGNIIYFFCEGRIIRKRLKEQDG